VGKLFAGVPPDVDMATATDVFPGDINIARCIHGDSLTRILADSAQVGSPQHGSGGIQLYDERVVASDRLAEAGARGTCPPPNFGWNTPAVVGKADELVTPVR
jgi:hypothetical protein